MRDRLVRKISINPSRILSFRSWEPNLLLMNSVFNYYMQYQMGQDIQEWIFKNLKICGRQPLKYLK